MEETMKLVIMVIIATALIVLGPLLLIWSLNTLFPVLAIEYDLATWAAAFILSATLTAKVKK